LGILAQQLGPYKRAVAYFSKQLDEVNKGWMSVSCSSGGLEYSGCPKIYLGPKDHSAGLTHSISCTGTKRELLAFPIPISTIPGHSD